MVARGALIRAGVKWLDSRSCPVNPDVIQPEAIKLNGSLTRIVVGGIIACISYVLLDQLGLKGEWLPIPCVAIGYACAIFLFPAATGSDNEP